MAGTIDLNADLGEAFGPWRMGDDDAMLSLVTSANVACGGHAGDPETMFRTLVKAARNGVAVGAHPGYADRQGFGRRDIRMPPAEVGRMVTAQVGALLAMARLADTEVVYVKPHGALANLAARDRDVAAAIVDVVGRLDAGLALLAISGTELEQVARGEGVTVYSEVFADRGYTADGQLVPRDQPGALIDDAHEAADRLLGFLADGSMPAVDGSSVELAVDSICVHGDSPGAVRMTEVVREALEAEGWTTAPFATAGA